VIHALLVIDKAEGVTSHDVVQAVRRWSKQRRVGHLGTLDPLATGVLPLALGEATKLSQLLTHGDKSYRGRIRLGIETTTYDREGEAQAEWTGAWPEREQVEKALDRFRGEIEQVPPPFSAVKLGGEAAYRRARRGEPVELPPRRVRLDRVELLGYEPPFVALEVDCSTGTYLRSLAHDLGRMLGTGAHLFELSRTRSGPFRLEQAVRVDELETRGRAALIPMARATGLPSFEVPARLAQRVAQGIQLGRHEVPGAPGSGTFQLEHKGRLVALLEGESGFPTLRTLRVFLEGTEA
jgi:tRNA pseudouridine55 synthase